MLFDLGEGLPDAVAFDPEGLEDQILTVLLTVKPPFEGFKIVSVVAGGDQVLVDGDKESIKIQLLDFSLHVVPCLLEPLDDLKENIMLSVFRKEL